MSLTDNTTYYGKDAEGFYSSLLTTGPTKEVVKMIPNVKSKIKLASFDFGNLLADADCSFSGAGEGTLAQKTFEVCPIKINLEYCQRTFEANYLSEQLRAGSNSDQVMPDSMQRYLMDQVAIEVSSKLEKVFWQGDAATSSYPLSLCDGVLLEAAGDSAVIDVAATASTISAANIITEFTRVYNAIPESVFTNGIEKVKLFVPVAYGKYYALAIAASTGNGGMFYNGEKNLDFLGIEVIATAGMPNGKMVAASVDNLLILTDLVSDFEALQILPQKGVTGVPVVRMIGEFKFGASYLKGAEVVLYS